MKPLSWTFVYARRSQPIAAFVDRALAEAYSGKAPELGETLVTRTLIIGAGGKAIQLLRDIVSNDNSPEGDQKLILAIEEARKLLKIIPEKD